MDDDPPATLDALLVLAKRKEYEKQGKRRTQEEVKKNKVKLSKRLMERVGRTGALNPTWDGQTDRATARQPHEAAERAYGGRER